MKKIFLFALFAFVLATPSVSSAAVTDLVWVNKIPYTNSDLRLTTDSSGNVYAIGSLDGSIDLDLGPGTTTISSSSGFSDVFVAKYTSAGSLVWAKAVGGANLSESPKNVKVDSSGNVFVLVDTVGNTADDIDPTESTIAIVPQGGGDTYVAKLNSSGVIQWAKIFGDSAGNQGFGLAVANDGSVYVSGFAQLDIDLDPGVGTSTATNNGTYDVFTVKLNSSGNFVWGNMIGGNGDDRPVDLQLDSSGNVYQLGYFYNTVDFDPGVGTTTATSAGGQDIYLQKLQSNGTFAWVKTFSSTATDNPVNIAIDSNSNIFIAGTTAGTSIDLNPGSGTDIIYKPGVYNMSFVSKLNSLGEYQWGRSVAVAGGEVVISRINIDSQGDLYTAGYFDTAFDINTDASGVQTLTSQASFDAFLSRIDASGDFIWGVQMPGVGSQSISDLSISGSAIYLIGTIGGETDFDPTAGQYLVPSSLGHFLLKLTTDVSAPVLTEVTPVPASTSNTTPSYVFTSDEVGTITYSGFCTSSTATTTASTNTLTFGPFGPGVYSNCSIAVKDASNNSSMLSIPSFTVTSEASASSPVTSGGGGGVASAGGGTSTKGCTDIKATNYERFVEHDSSLCVYSKAVQQVVVPGKTTVVFTRDLQVGSVGPDVEILQRVLILRDSGKAAKALAANGTTQRFGQLTKNALKEFQKANGIVPATGNLGPKTRIFIGSMR